jgi:hypothetical protein
MVGKVALVVGAAVLVAFGVLFRRRQKPGAIGGPISAAKAYWLSFAIYLWFVVCPVVGCEPTAPSSLRLPLLVVGVSMWLRGAAEMVMLYGTKTWRPPLGIAHDILTIILLLAMVAAGVVGGEGLVWSPMAMATSMAMAMLMTVVLSSLVLEIVHARTFFAVVGAGTVGDDGVWFADDDDPRFITINRRTRWGNVALSVPTGLFVALWLYS